MGVEGPIPDRDPSSEFMRKKSTNFDKNEGGAENLEEAINTGDVNPPDLGQENAQREANPYTMREYAAEKIEEKQAENALYDKLAKRVPENLIPSTLEGWLYTTRQDCPLQGERAHARAFMVRGQHIEPDVRTLAEYVGITQDDKVKVLDEVLKEEFAFEANRPFLDYMLEKHQEIKQKLTDHIWDKFPGFRLKESAAEQPGGSYGGQSTGA